MYTFSAADIVAGLFSSWLAGWVAGFVWLKICVFVDYIKQAT